MGGAKCDAGRGELIPCGGKADGHSALSEYGAIEIALNIAV